MLEYQLDQIKIVDFLLLANFFGLVRIIMDHPLDRYRSISWLHKNRRRICTEACSFDTEAQQDILTTTRVTAASTLLKFLKADDIKISK